MATCEVTNFPWEHSLWARPMRPLLDEGKPIGEVVILCLDAPGIDLWPICAVTHTSKDRLVAWPILPPNVASQAVAIDHITLELSSGKIHGTGFRADGRRRVTTNPWRLHEFRKNGLTFWFRLVVRFSVLKTQGLHVERQVKFPASDDARRQQEFARYGQNLDIVGVPLPSANPQGDCVLCSICLVSGESPVLNEDIFLCGGIDNFVESWQDGTLFAAAYRDTFVGEKRLLVATACPPGRAAEDVVVGLARKDDS